MEENEDMFGNMKSTLLSLFIVLLLLLSCTNRVMMAGKRSDDNVYRTCIQDIGMLNDSLVILIINNTTNTWGENNTVTPETMGKNPQLKKYANLIKAFDKANQSTVPLKIRCRNAICDFVPRDYIDEITRSNPKWANLGSFPVQPSIDTVLLQFSKIGYYENLAMVYVESRCGKICGYGEFRMLEKKEGKWIRIDALSTWASDKESEKFFLEQQEILNKINNN